MRLQKILIIAIFVLILTVGAVSASDNNQTSDSLTVNDDDEIETLDEDAADYGGDVSLSMDDKDEKLAVGTEDPSMNVIVDDIMEGQDAVVNVSLESDATRDLFVELNGTNLAEFVNYVVPVTNGSASLSISNLLAGNYTVKTTYPGDGKYASATLYSNLTVMPGVMFKNLQTLINDDTTGEITLDRDYYGNSTEIVISKTITINGNGHTLNANGSSRIFHITAENVVINNLTFVNASAESDGGAVYFDSDSTGIVRNCNFINNNVTGGSGYGGAVYFNGDSVVENCNFVNNYAGYWGGAVYFNVGGNVTNCNFTNNTADSGGGAVYFNVGGNVTNCNFVNNYADEWGGAVYFEGSGNVTNCNFVNNSAFKNGAVYIHENGNVADCNFTNNKATAANSWGGAIFFDQYSYGSVINCYFVNNTANVEGGAVYFDYYSTGNVTNCYFVNNTANVGGGAVYFDGGGNVTDCNFVNNNAVDSGGAVYFFGTGNVTNCKFIGNTAGDGGAIYFIESTYRVMNCSFANSVASRNGGAVHICRGLGDILNCSFVNSTAGQSGGAVYFDESCGNFVDCSFLNSYSEKGGAICIEDNSPGTTVVNECSFVNSTASDYSGGAIHFGTDVTGELTNCIFTDSSTNENGGAIYFDGEGTVINCAFIANEASGNGGAVYFRSSGIVRGCNFTNNTVTGNLCSGSAIYFNRDGNGWGIVANCNFNHNIKSGYGEPSTVDFVNGNVTNCKFNNNNGGLTWSKTTGNVLNCEFTNNGGIAIYVYSSGSCTVANCSFTNNYRPVNIEGSGNVTNCNFTNSSGSVIGMFDGNVINCSFTNNKRAIDLSYGNVTGCSFAYNFENIDNGGAILMNYGNVTDCSFIGNAAFNNGGAVYFEGSGNVTGCNFIGNLAVESLGGAVYFKNNGNVINCNFTNNSARSAGAVYFEGSGNVTDCNFVNNNATGSAGGVFCSNEVTITNCSFTNNSAEDGGAVYIYENGNVTNCNFIGCMADCGGAVYISGNVTGCTFIGCMARHGGAVYFATDGTVTNCNFIGNTAGDGGAIYATESICSVMSCSFVNSTAGDCGGAVYVDEDSIGYFVDCSFLNSYSQKGGAVCIGDNSPGTTVVNGCSFVNSVASNSAESDSLGGAIHFGKDVTGNVTNCKFTDSSANLDGGAIYFDGKGTVIDCTFINNKGDRGCGGAIYFKGDSVVENCNFVNNSAYAGGAVYFYENGNVTNCNFTDNNVTGDGSTGGAVYVYENGNVTNCNFVNNYADGFGAAVYFEGSGNVTNCNFVDNSAFETGAVYLDENGNVADCNFTNNKATRTVSWGGAIFVNKYCNYSVINCNFVNNTAGSEGGAVYIDEYSAGTVTNCNFTNNTAGYGGAVYFWGTGNVTNCNFVNNTAGSEGGAVYIDENGNVTNCNFVNNTAGGNGGAVYSTGSYCIVSNSNFTDNLAEFSGGAIYWYGAFNSKYNTVDGSIFTNNTAHGNAANAVDTRGGGAIYWSENGERGTVKNSKFYYNSVQSTIDKKVDGGAILWDKNMHALVDNCIFVGNFVTTNGDTSGTSASDVWAQGGAMYLRSNGNYTVMNCLFENCSSSKEAGALYIQGLASGSVRMILLENLVFINNVAYAMGNYNINGGGAIQIKQCTNSVFHNLTFINNTANRGGALCVFNTVNNLVVDGATFDGNKAFGNGGGIYASSKFTANNMTFSNCEALQDGGAVYVTGSSAHSIIQNSTFTHNTAGENGGAVYAADSNVEIVHSHFEDNVAVMGGAIYGCTYDDDCTFEANSKPQIYPYSKVNATMEIAAVYDEDLKITVTLPDDATGDVNITVAGILYSKSITNGSCIMHIYDLSSGDYDISATYGGDVNYLPTSNSTHVTISKTEPVITVDADNVVYGETESVNVVLPADATGSVEFTLRNANSQIIDNKNSILTGGTASYTLPENLNVGKYALNTQYSGDSRYEGSLSCSTFYVSPKISITPDVTIGDDGVITMDLGDVTGSIWVYLDWEKEGSQTIRQGKFVYHLPTWAMTVGNHTIYFKYEGNSFDENVFNQWNNETGTYEPILYHFLIHKKQSESEAETKGEVLEVILEDANGTVLSNATGNIEFTILNQLTNEVTKVVVAIVNGIASLDISQFNDGNYIISWYYAGDDKHVPMSKTMSLQISRKVSRITAGDLSTVYSSSQAYSVRVYGVDGYPVAGVPVTFLINNRAFRTVTTDRNGFASVAITQAPGNYKITAKSQTVSVTKNLAVIHVLSLSKVSVKRTAKKITIKATLKKVNGKYLKGKKITFRFNGKKYTAKTNKKGVAKITVKKNVLKKLRKGKKVTYQATYLKDTVKKSVKVR